MRLAPRNWAPRSTGQRCWVAPALLHLTSLVCHCGRVHRRFQRRAKYSTEQLYGQTARFEVSWQSHAKRDIKKHMPTIPDFGNLYDFYSCNGNDEFAIFPSGLVSGFDTPTPIKLQRGDASWGARHIATKHGVWLAKHKLEAHEMVWHKLRETGVIYSAETDDKLKLSLRISPTSLLILRYRAAQSFFTVVSCYAHPSQLDGTPIAKWPGQSALGPMPNFCLPAAAPTSVTIKKRRTFERPG